LKRFNFTYNQLRFTVGPHVFKGEAMKIFKPVLLTCVSAFVLAIAVPGCVAQTFSASIGGVITDPSGSVVQGAKVHLRNMGTNDTRDTTSTSAGTYKFDNLLPGTYEITAEAAGFKTYQQSNMILRASTAATVNVPLAIGGSEQSVQVTAEAVLLDTESATNLVTMDSHLIEAFPNSYRNPLNFVFALAGTTEGQAGLTSRSGSFDQNGSMFGLNGGRTGNEQVLIDGAPSTAVDWGGLLVAPVNDSVQEQQIVQNVYDAQYERSGAGVVTLITKSGSNSFHGAVYDYMRNSALDANSWGNGYNGAPKGLFHRNQFGAYLGGPISRSHHLYFYAAYEGLRQPETDSSGPTTMPTAAERSGDFSHTFNPDGSLQVIYNPFTTDPVTHARQPFAGNIIPSNLINPVGQALVNLYPQPNRANEGPGPNDNNNYFAQAPGRTDNDKFDWRIDWGQSEKNRVFVRMSDRVRQNNVPACFFCNGADTGSNNEDYGFQLVLNDSYTPSPTWVIDGYAAYGRWWEGQTQVGLGKQNLSAIGLSPALSPQVNGLPLVHADIYSSQGTDFSTFDRYIRSNVTWIGNATKQFSRHTLKFGANYDIAFMNLRSDRPVTFDFGRSFTSCEPAAGGGCQAVLSSETFTTGNAIASMLLGTGSGSSVISMDPAMSLHTVGLYVQDQWRATNRLTITAGLRYENQRPATERYNRLTYFDPNAVNPISGALGSTIHGAFEYAGKDNRYAWGSDNLNFAPRLGVAYKVTDKLVARVGAGMFYAPASAMVSFDSPGQFLGFSSTTPWVGSQSSAGFIPSNLVSDPFPSGLVQPVGSASDGLVQVGDGAGQIWPKGQHPIGYTEQWSADLQYQLGTHSVVEIGYTGTRGRRLMYGNPDLNADQLPTSDLSLGSQLLADVPNPFSGIIDPSLPLGGPTIKYNQLLRPYPQYSYLNYTRSLPGASSAYDALTLKYTKQFSGGLSLISSYVWSKALDDGSEDLIGWAIGGLWRDTYNPKLDYAISMHDVPQSFATAFVYDLPYGHGKHWGGGAPAGVSQVLGNWQVSGIVRLTSGLPLLAPFYADNPLADNFGFPGMRFPDLVGDPKPAHQTTTNWINPNAFAQPGDFDNGIYKLGDMPSRMTQLREGATKNLDLSVAKGFDISERFKAQFRAEFLNAFNHPTYGGFFYGGFGSNIDLCIDCGTLGTVRGTRNDPRNIQLSLKVMF
jgi:hypothetical protein